MIIFVLTQTWSYLHASDARLMGSTLRVWSRGRVCELHKFLQHTEPRVMLRFEKRMATSLKSKTSHVATWAIYEVVWGEIFIGTLILPAMCTYPGLQRRQRYLSISSVRLRHHSVST